MSTTLLVLKQRLSEQVGDWIECLVTTAIAASTSIVSTNLNVYDDGVDDAFNNWWVYIVDEANAGVLRKISNYVTSGGTITVHGANLTTDGANLATIRVGRFSEDNKRKAIIDAVREIYPHLFRKFDLQTLVAGNILPNSHFEDWAVTTAPDKYTMQDSNITATALTTVVRGGAKSMNALTGAGGAGKYVYITSNTYPRLLDLMHKTIDFKCWAYPEDADDATIEIYTVKADGTTTQTLTSTTSCPATAWTLLELENQEINDNIVEIQFRFKITTASKYVYFDAARVQGRDIYEYLLPTDVENGHVSQVFIQTQGYSDDPCDDLHPRHWEEIFGCKRINDGTDTFIHLPYLYGSSYKIRLYGIMPLETLSADSDTISLDGERVNLLIAYAKYKFWQYEEQPTASEDSSRYESASQKAYGEYLRLLPRLGMVRPGEAMNLPIW